MVDQIVAESKLYHGIECHGHVHGGELREIAYSD